MVARHEENSPARRTDANLAQGRPIVARGDTRLWDQALMRIKARGARMPPLYDPNTPLDPAAWARSDQALKEHSLLIESQIAELELNIDQPEKRINELEKLLQCDILDLLDDPDKLLEVAGRLEDPLLATRLIRLALDPELIP